MRWRACESLIAGLESASCSSSSFSPLCGPMRRVAPLWSEIDWAGRKWTVPAERMKERIEHEVPLSSAALAVLRETRHHPDLENVRQRSGESDLVFPDPQRASVVQQWPRQLRQATSARLRSSRLPVVVLNLVCRGWARLRLG